MLPLNAEGSLCGAQRLKLPSFNKQKLLWGTAGNPRPKIVWSILDISKYEQQPLWAQREYPEPNLCGSIKIPSNTNSSPYGAHKNIQDERLSGPLKLPRQLFRY